MVASNGVSEVMSHFSAWSLRQEEMTPQEFSKHLQGEGLLHNASQEGYTTSLKQDILQGCLTSLDQNVGHPG